VYIDVYNLIQLIVLPRVVNDVRFSPADSEQSADLIVGSYLNLGSWKLPVNVHWKEAFSSCGIASSKDYP
jgi:hypothetical protein